MSLSNQSKFRFLCLGAFVLLLAAVSTYTYKRFTYENQLDYFAIDPAPHNVLTIGLIGDSWVADGQLNEPIEQLLSKKGIKSKTMSSGKHGAMSKRIYQNIFAPAHKSKSSKFIIENKPDYVIVVAGVNDAVGQVGADFYAYHVDLIISTLIHYGVRPVLVELPEFGIEEATARLGSIRSLRNKISAYLTNEGKVDNIEIYRNALVKKLQSTQNLNKIIYLPFDIICRDYNDCPKLYKDPMHL